MAVESSFTVPDAVSFAEAIALTQALLDGLEQGKVTAATLETTIAALVCSENGARGFFVTYLSADRALADQPMPTVVAALQTASAIVSPLLVKNLAMSVTECFAM